VGDKTSMTITAWRFEPARGTEEYFEKGVGMFPRGLVYP